MQIILNLELMTQYFTKPSKSLLGSTLRRRKEKEHTYTTTATVPTKVCYVWNYLFDIWMMKGIECKFKTCFAHSLKCKSYVQSIANLCRCTNVNLKSIILVYNFHQRGIPMLRLLALQCLWVFVTSRGRWKKYSLPGKIVPVFSPPFALLLVDEIETVRI